jgi:serine/threonine-protein kinase
MSSVYEATDTRMGRRVAVKVMSVSANLPEDERHTLIQRLQREARVVAALSHPNIVTLFDIGEQDGAYYLVMEYLDGETLRQRLAQSGPLTYAEAAQVLEQAGDALDAVHAAGVVHRDLKPSNILLLPGLHPERGELRVKLLDFGVALPSDDVLMTTPGMIVGTPTYLAPELIAGEKATPASDLWAMGVLLYEMLSGRAPFAADTVTAVLYRIAHEQPAPLPEVPPAIQDLLAFALDKDPAQRFTSGQALANAFRAALEAGDLPPTLEMPPGAGAASERTTVVSPRRVAHPAPTPVSASIPPPIRRREERRTLSAGMIAGLFLLALTALVGGSFLALRNGQRQVATVPPAATPTPKATAKAETTPTPKPTPRRATPKPPPGPRAAQTPSPAAPTPSPTLKPSPSTAALPTPSPAVPTIVERPTPTPPPTPRPLPAATPRVPAVAEERGANQPTPTPSPAATPDGEPPPPEIADKLTELTALRDEWLGANEAREVEEQARFYTNRLERYYTRADVPRGQVLQDKARTVGSAARVILRAGEPTIELSEDEREAIMIFRKQYAITGGSGAGRGVIMQELRWRRTRDGWKIYSERDLRALRR